MRMKLLYHEVTRSVFLINVDAHGHINIKVTAQNKMKKEKRYLSIEKLFENVTKNIATRKRFSKKRCLGKTLSVTGK